VNNKRNGRYASDDDPEYANLANGKGTPTYREKIEEDGRRKAANRTKERFVRLGEIMTGSPAWKALGRGGRDAYFWIERRYRKTNNGKIPMGARVLADLMGVNKDTANLYIRRLQALGFIAASRKGHFGDRTGAPRSTRWRLTEYSMDGAPPTRDYLNLGMVEAAQRVRETSQRDSKRLHPGRKRKFERPKNADVTSEKPGRERPKNPDINPNPYTDTDVRTSVIFGQSTAVPGGGACSPDPRPLLRDIAKLQRFQERVRLQAAGRPSPLNDNHAVPGKITPSLSKQKNAIAHHARRSAAANSLSDADAIKEKITVTAKRRDRDLKNLARKIQCPN
jgi:hypothetical protein